MSSESDLVREQQAIASAPLKVGLFDIQQVDLLADAGTVDVAAMLATRLDQLALADELGLDAAFTAERHFLPSYVSSSATTWLAAASQRATRLRLGVMGYTLPFRQPIQLAEEVAVLDLLAKGRLEVGFGLGHRVEELEAVGIAPADRITIFQERLAVLQALWTGGTISYERGSVVAKDVTLSPLPAQEPHPPLWFAGTEPIAAHWMGSRGLGLAVGFKPNDALIPAVTGFLAGRLLRTPEAIAVEPARPLGTIALMRAVYLSDDDERAFAEIADDLLLLDEKFVADATEANRAERRSTAQDRARAMTQGGMMYIGSAESVTSQLQATRAKLPFDVLLANVHGAAQGPERVERTIRLLAEVVRPALTQG